MTMDIDVYNKAVELSLEWGMNFGKPIRDRLTHFYPDLYGDSIKRLEKESKDIQSYAFDMYWKEVDGEFSLAEIRMNIREKYPWLNDNNLSLLETQGMYYARK